MAKPVDSADLFTRVRSRLSVRHLSQELDRTLAYIEELEVARRSGAGAAQDPGPSRAAAR